jgi:histone acetyltransferase (RNA polymerase elongator complex component)
MGCQMKCSFCNQHIITGNSGLVTKEDVNKAVQKALKSGHKGAQLAFFGGSFTAVDRDYMLSLLEAAGPFIKNGDISGIRISTRPDFIDADILKILKSYGVTAIELGAQSMDDGVLAQNDRGHTSDDVLNASLMIKQYGFELGVQMMTGLYTDTDEKSLSTAQKLAKLGPQTIRIYPTVVLKGTKLHELYLKGEYVPQTLDQAVNLCSRLILFFESMEINVIRVGLHSGGAVEEGFVAGAYHPAFKELCESKIYLDKALQKIDQEADLECDKNSGLKSGEPAVKAGYTLFVSPGEISKMTGHKKSNIIELDKKGFSCKVKQDNALKKYDIRVEKDGKK